METVSEFPLLQHLQNYISLYSPITRPVTIWVSFKIFSLLEIENIFWYVTYLITEEGDGQGLIPCVCVCVWSTVLMPTQCFFNPLSAMDLHRFEDTETLERKKRLFCVYSPSVGSTTIVTIIPHILRLFVSLHLFSPYTPILCNYL